MRAPAATAACWQRSPCLGLCEQAPAALVIEAGPTAVRGDDPARDDGGGARRVGRGAAGGRGAPRRGPRRGSCCCERVGRVDPASLDSYRAHGGYQALRRAFDLGPAGVIRELTDARLLGRGGAAFPAGRKWDAVARHPVHPHYLVCNADESEPGTFKDRVVMEGDPFAVVEAMTIAGFTTGCERGYRLPPRRVPARPRAPHPRGRVGAGRVGCSATT